MTPLEKAINEACRIYVQHTRADIEFAEMRGLQKFLVLETVTALVAPAIKVYEEAKADEPGN